MKEEAEDAHLEICNLKKENESMVDQVKKLEKGEATMKEEVESSKTMIMQLEVEVGTLKSKLTQTDSLLEMKQNEWDIEKQRLIDNKEAMIALYEADNAAIKAEVETAKGTVDRLEQEKDEFKKKVSIIDYILLTLCRRPLPYIDLVYKTYFPLPPLPPSLLHPCSMLTLVISWNTPTFLLNNVDR